ncbi:MAG: AAA family ATPase [Planctomycetaceae bacterium]|nr:AAA family ATPase [Planctomycetaceae bacterium]
MSEASIFDSETILPDDQLAARSLTLLGFDERFARVKNQLRLLLHADQIQAWNQKNHGGHLALGTLVSDQYPLVIFHGDVGTGKTAMAECMANRLVEESRTEDSILFKMSNRVRGSGKVGEMGTLMIDAFQKVTQSAGKSRRAILIIDEGDSLAAARSQAHSHHEDKVAVNTLIQSIDELRKLGGRVVTILCTNRLSALDPALVRRAAIIEEFKRPSDIERQQLLSMDLATLNLKGNEMEALVAATGAKNGQPTWTYSDIRTRLYPSALSRAFPARPLTFDDLLSTANAMRPSPVLEDA